MNTPREMLIYNLFPLLAGPFTAWAPHLQRAADLGFNWVFLNPVQQPGSSGSLYSIADYFALNPVLVDPAGTQPPEAQLRNAIQSGQDLGLRFMVDLVINHCSTDAPLIKEHPKWFDWEHGRVAHPFCHADGKKVVWRDLARFNHHTADRKGLVSFFQSIINFLIDCGCSAFRCDAAYQVPSEIWRELIQTTKSEHPGVLFLAETLGCAPDQTRKTAQAGFDYIFNSSKWWDYHSHWLMSQYNLTRETAPSVSFPESHDTPRLFEETGGNVAAMKQRYLFAALFSAAVMMPMGFEFGCRRKLHVVKTAPADFEQTDVDISEFIGRVNGIKQTCPVFQEEAPTQVLPHGNGQILLMWKGAVASSGEALLILNKDVHHHQEVYIENLQHLVQAGAELHDVSPEDPMEFLPAPFHYNLRPGEGIVLLTSRDEEEKV